MEPTDPFEIALEPTLAHCIETQAKREYERLKRTLMEAEQPDDLTAAKLETLRSFLSGADFPRLRGEYEPYLVQGKKVRFVLRPSTEGAAFRMEVI
jgi:hypothetical protein